MEIKSNNQIYYCTQKVFIVFAAIYFYKEKDLILFLKLEPQYWLVAGKFILRSASTFSEFLCFDFTTNKIKIAHLHKYLKVT